jgi:hypothetical protein
VVYVSANDKGIFYASLDHKKLKFYQVGEYKNEYQGEESSEGQANTVISSLAKVVNGQYVVLPATDFYNLEPGTLYYTRADIYLNFGKTLGSLRITPFTYFSLKDQNTIILLKGQLTVDFASPLKIYAIKFDRFNLNLFEEKLKQFLNGSLPSEEYFLVQNVHTKFIVKNEAGKINVAVEKGEVEVKGKNLTKKVAGGKQIVIDKKNNLKESVFIPNFVVKILTIVILIILAILLFIYRKTKIVQFILKTLKNFFLFLMKLIKRLINKWLKKDPKSSSG